MPIRNPQTDWSQTSGSEDFIRQATQKEAARQMQKFDLESKEMGLVENPTASVIEEARHNAREYGFDPPEEPDYGPLSGPIDPESGMRMPPTRQTPGFGELMTEGGRRYLRDEAERGTYVPGVPAPPGLPGRPPGGRPFLGILNPPVEQRLPPTKVYSAPIAPMVAPRFGPVRNPVPPAMRRPLPQG